jgi:hypothetical protein
MCWPDVGWLQYKDLGQISIQPQQLFLRVYAMSFIIVFAEFALLAVGITLQLAWFFIISSVQLSLFPIILIIGLAGRISLIRAKCSNSAVFLTQFFLYLETWVRAKLNALMVYCLIFVARSSPTTDLLRVVGLLQDDFRNKECRGKKLINEISTLVKNPDSERMQSRLELVRKHNLQVATDIEIEVAASSFKYGLSVIAKHTGWSWTRIERELVKNRSQKLIFENSLHARRRNHGTSYFS